MSHQPSNERREKIFERFRRICMPLLSRCGWQPLLDYQQVAAEMVSRPEGLEALAREADHEVVLFLVIAILVREGAFDESLVLRSRYGAITFGASADSPKKAGRKLSAEEVLKVRIGVSLSAEVRADARKGIVALPEASLEKAEPMTTVSCGSSRRRSDPRGGPGSRPPSTFNPPGASASRPSPFSERPSGNTRCRAHV